MGGDPELSRQGQAMAHTLPTAVALLKKSVELGHPVAQYRLALFYITYLPQKDIAAAACPLLEASIRQGFAPAALGITPEISCNRLLVVIRMMRQQSDGKLVATTDDVAFEMSLCA